MLAASTIVDIADAGDRSDPAERGRLLLAAARPAWPAASLGEVDLGARDACALELRCGTFGSTLPARTECPACDQALSVDVDAARLRRRPAPHDRDPSEAVVVECGDGLVVEARTPDGAALARAAACPDVGTARAALVQSCVVRATADGTVVEVAALPDDVVATVGEAIVETDPQAEARVSLTCALCEHEWVAVFDACAFLWNEVETTAVRLLDDVHVLATAYGWSEEQVLELPSRRRRRYVERLVDA